MPIPEFNEIKVPALEFLSDGKPHNAKELYSALAGKFQLTEQEKVELLPSGTQPRWHNRVNWACYDLYRAGLLDRLKKGTYTISELGRQVAAQKPQKIDREYLMRYPQFAKWIAETESNARTAAPNEQAATPAQTPNEAIEAAHKTLHAQLRLEVLEHVRKMDPVRFEQLVLELLLAMGYGGSREEAAQMTKLSHDEGIDGVINEDRLGLDVIYVQAKRWQATVGRREIQSFVGALAGQQAHKGIFITTSDFAGTARDYAKSISQKVILVDGNRLAELMIEHNIGVSRAHSYEVKRIDSDYFEEA
jgi:restriction system protein